MPSTPYKGYSVPTTGSEVGVWGDDINANSFGTIDTNMGGVVSKSVAGSNITLTSDEAKNCIIRLTGSQSADIQLMNPNKGFYFVENLTTNSFNITVTNGVSGIIVPKGRSTVIADSTNGCRIAGSDSFPPGTRMIFQQTLAPTGWTKEVGSTYNDNAIRLNTGSVTQSGSVAFSTLFSGFPTGVVGDTTLTASQVPSHQHFISNPSTGDKGDTPTLSASNYMAWFGQGGGTAYSTYSLKGVNGGASIGLTNSVGGDQSHTHSFTGTTNLAVKYTDVIIAQKN